MKCVFFIFLLACSHAAWADPAAAYKQALAVAAQGEINTAIAMLQGAEQSTSLISPWHARIQAAKVLLTMQRHQVTTLSANGNPYLQLAQHYAKQKQATVRKSSTLPVLLAALLAGAGHAWLGRWHDALIAALLVWPMLGLTLWAWRRKMGPVTVFFAVITVWLWSGTVFSAMSLAERGQADHYALWWQALWLSSGLGGHVPW